MWKVLIFVSYMKTFRFGFFFRVLSRTPVGATRHKRPSIGPRGRIWATLIFGLFNLLFLKTHFDSPTMLIFDTWDIYIFSIPSATVVQNFNTFWVNITSPELRNSVNPVPGPSCQTNGNQDNAGADLKAHTVFSILSILSALFFVL